MASDTRQRLVRTTGRLLRQQGYAATGLNQVIAVSDAPKGSLYFHFPGGKEELAAAAVEHFAGRITAALDKGLANAPTVGEAVTQFFDDYIDHVERTEFRDGCAVATVALDEAHTHPLLASAATDAFTTWTGRIAEALVAEGRAPDEAAGLATLVIATIEGALVMAKGQQSVEPLVRTRDTLRAVLAPPNPSEIA